MTREAPGMQRVRLRRVPASACLAAALLTLPLSVPGAAARPVTASQLSAAPYGRVPIRSNRPEWEIYNGNRPGGSPLSGILGYSGAWGVPGFENRGVAPVDRELR